MCFPGGGGSSTTHQTVENTIPPHIEEASKRLLDTSEPLARRDYPIYGDPRIAEFNPDQIEAFQRTRENVASWSPIFLESLSQAAQSGVPLGQEDIDAYTNPYTSSVIDSTVNQINRQFDMDEINRHSQMAQRGSFLNEDRRAVIDNEAEANRNRVIAETVAGLNMQGFNNALSQGNIQRDRTGRTAAMFSGLAPQLSALNFQDIGALRDVGGQQEGKEQQGLSLQYEDFLRQFYYPQEQQNFQAGILSGVPYSTSQQTTSTVPQAGSNPFSSILGIASLAAPFFGGGAGAGAFGAGWTPGPADWGAMGISPF